MTRHFLINLCLVLVFCLFVFSPFIALATQSLFTELQSDARLASMNKGQDRSQGAFVTLHYEW